MDLGANLAHQNIPGHHLLTAVPLYATPLTVRIATVAAGTLTLFMCHGSASRAKPQADG
jgi:hypothetical protein